MPRGEPNWRIAVGLALIAAAAYALFFNPPPRPAERFGYEPNPEGTAEFLRELDKPLFAQAGADVIRQAKKVDTSDLVFTFSALLDHPCNVRCRAY